MGEEADLVVRAFEGSVGEAIAEEVKDAVEVFGDGDGDAAEGLESRAFGGVEPGKEESRAKRVFLSARRSAWVS